MEEQIQKFGSVPVTHQVLMSLLKTYARPNDKIYQWIKEGKLIPLGKGKYLIHPEISKQAPNLSEISNTLYGPSYVSLEYMLRQYGAIPEHVFNVTAVTSKRSVLRRNSFGTFTYIHVPQQYFPLGIISKKLENGRFAMVASPEKALCDIVVCTPGVRFRSVSSVGSWVNFMRVDTDWLLTLDFEQIRNWLPKCPKRESLEFLIKYLEHDIRLVE